MRVYIAYVSEYMECPELLGVYSTEHAAQTRAKERAESLDVEQDRLFAGDDTWVMHPAAWFTLGYNVQDE